MGFLIDSSVLIAAERGRISLDQALAVEGSEPVAISVITASELLHGVHRAQSAQQAGKRQLFATFLLDLLPIVPFDLYVARRHAALWAGLQSRGLVIGAHDLIIAATALTLSYGVITLNESEFQHVAELRIINPINL